jgi:hypothetical protein
MTERIGPASFVLSTDLGQEGNPTPANSLLEFVDGLVAEGLTEGSVATMVRDTRPGPPQVGLRRRWSAINRDHATGGPASPGRLERVRLPCPDMPPIVAQVWTAGVARGTMPSETREAHQICTRHRIRNPIPRRSTCLRRGIFR